MWIWIVVLLVGSLVVIGLTSQKGPGALNIEGDLSSYPVTENDHIRGDLSKAKVVVVEYGDFQCPACKSYASLLTQAEAIYGEELAVVFRHYPLIEIHPHALISSKAAEAAGAQDKFFEMHDLLYLNQEEWATSATPEILFASYARTLGLDVEKFNTDLSSQAAENVIRTDRENAKALNLSGTPSLFVNGKLIPLPQTGGEFQKVIDDTLQAVEAGTSQ